MEAETEVSASLAPLRDRKSVVRSMIERVGTHNLSLLIALTALVAIFGGLRPDIFFLVRNILNIGQAIAILGVLATAQTIVIVSGGLDISVGAIVGMSTVYIALAVGWTGSPLLSILLGVVVGAIAGVVNGVIITVGRINAVIATLGTMAVFRGFAFIISNGQSISIFDPAFRFIGNGKILNVAGTRGAPTVGRRRSGRVRRRTARRRCRRPGRRAPGPRAKTRARAILRVPSRATTALAGQRTPLTMMVHVPARHHARPTGSAKGPGTIGTSCLSTGSTCAALLWPRWRQRCRVRPRTPRSRPMRCARS